MFSILGLLMLGLYIAGFLAGLGATVRDYDKGVLFVLASFILAGISSFVMLAMNYG
jgi:predicted branched-subunit amino acid permease